MNLNSASEIKKRNKIIVYALLIVSGVFAGFPILWMLLMSLRPNSEIFDVPPQFIPDTSNIDAYLEIIRNPTTMRFFVNSYFVAIAVTVISLLVSIHAAYGFSRFSFKGKKVFNLFIISTQTIPTITLLIPYFGMIVFFRIYDTFFALILTYLALTLPYGILMMTGYFNSLPKELDEAVLIDGGSRFYALWRVLVPVSIPGMVATATYTFILAWNEFLLALTLIKSTEMRTIPVGISLLMGEHAFQWNTMMAMSIMGSFPVLLLYLFAQKYFLSGMTAGSVKM